MSSRPTLRSGKQSKAISTQRFIARFYCGRAPSEIAVYSRVELEESPATLAAWPANLAASSSAVLAHRLRPLQAGCQFAQPLTPKFESSVRIDRYGIAHLLQPANAPVPGSGLDPGVYR